jgi:hypothetical protein
LRLLGVIGRVSRHRGQYIGRPACHNATVPPPETRVMPYANVVRKVIEHHRDQGELVDFWLMKGGAIVGCYRVRPDVATPWTDLLPTGTSGERYQQVIQGLAAILYPGESLTVQAIERTNGEVRLTVEPATP